MVRVNHLVLVGLLLVTHRSVAIIPPNLLNAILQLSVHLKSEYVVMARFIVMARTDTSSNITDQSVKMVYCESSMGYSAERMSKPLPIDVRLNFVDLVGIIVVVFLWPNILLGIQSSQRNVTENMSMAWHKTAMTPLLTNWSYCSPALDHRCVVTDVLVKRGSCRHTEHSLYETERNETKQIE